jgi:hypothetical protein
MSDNDVQGGFLVPDELVPWLEDEIAGKHRRIREMQVSAELIAMIGSGTYRVVANEVPDGARLVHAECDDAGTIRLYLEHETFDPVPLAQKIPLHPSPMIERLA